VSVIWLGEEAKRPPGLAAPHLMYLGRGPDVAVFLACGRHTIVVPADDVVVNILYENREYRDDAATQRGLLDEACR
jgi:hypothetical protein